MSPNMMARPSKRYVDHQRTNKETSPLPLYRNDVDLLREGKSLAVSADYIRANVPITTDVKLTRTTGRMLTHQACHRT